METITINRKKILVSRAEERVMYTLTRHNYAAPLGAFEAGRGSNTKNEARQLEGYDAKTNLGVEIWWRGATLYAPKRVTRFFADNPRHQYCVAGNPRRVNLVMKKIEELCK